MKTKPKTNRKTDKDRLQELMEKVEELSSQLEENNNWKEEKSHRKFIENQVWCLMLECKPKNTVHDPKRIAEHLHLPLRDVYQALSDLRVKGRVHPVFHGYCLWNDPWGR